MSTIAITHVRPTAARRPAAAAAASPGSALRLTRRASPSAARLDVDLGAPGLLFTFLAPDDARVAALGVRLVGLLQSQPLEYVAVQAEEGEAQRVLMPPDELRKARLLLDEPVRVRQLDLTIRWKAPGRVDSTGLAEVELQRR